MPSQQNHQHIIWIYIVSYSLQSHKFDEDNKKILLVLGHKTLPNAISLNYTPFPINTRASSSSYNTFYYIDLKGVSIGIKCLKLPSKLIRFHTKGNGGTIIDSGTTFSIFNEEIYENITVVFAYQIGFRRASEVEARTGMGLYYNFSGVYNVLLPEFTFHFNGGLDIVLHGANYFTSFGIPST